MCRFGLFQRITFFAKQSGDTAGAIDGLLKHLQADKTDAASWYNLCLAYVSIK